VTGLLAKAGFGCVGLTGQPTRAAALRLLEEACGGGITYFDTAPGYGQGYSERLLGEFLRKRKNAGLSVATKFGLGVPRWGALPPSMAVPLNYWRKKAKGRRFRQPLPGGAAPLLPWRSISREQIRAGFDQSRRSLGVERIDCYLLHEGLPAFVEEEALDLLLELKRQGAIGQLGLAANGRNYHGLDAAMLAHWDILQYEFGPAWKDNQELPARFADKRHFFHSIFKDHRTVLLPGVAPEDVPARILQSCIEANPNGKVLFFSGNPAHIRRNLRWLADAQTPARGD